MQPSLVQVSILRIRYLLYPLRILDFDLRSLNTHTHNPLANDDFPNDAPIPLKLHK